METDCQQPKNTKALDYFRERGSFVIENENGWANYYIQGKMAWIENFYIYPEKRNKQAGTGLLNHVEMEIFEVRGVNMIYTFVSKDIGDKDSMLKILPKRGFNYLDETERVFVFTKEL